VSDIKCENVDEKRNLAYPFTKTLI